MYKRIVVTGSLAYDQILNFPSTFVNQILPKDADAFAISYVMKKFAREYGGTAGNISYNLGRFKTKTLIIATAGKDFLRYHSHLKKLKSIDTSKIKIYKNELSANGFVMTDQENNRIWSFYEGAMNKACEQDLGSILTKGDLLVISANNPLAMINFAYAAIEKGIDYVFDPAYTIPQLPTVDLLQMCKHAKIVVGNEYEIAKTLERIGWSLQNLLNSVDIVVTTRGKNGSVVASRKKLVKVKTPEVKKNDSEATGAGDAYRGGFLAAYIRGLDIETCAKVASITASFAVEKTGSQNHKFSLKEFEKRYTETYKSNFPQKIFD